MDGFALEASGNSGLLPGFSSEDATATATETTEVSIAGGNGAGNLLLNFALTGTGYEYFSSGVASMNFSVSVDGSQLENQSCPYYGGDYAGYECQQPAYPNAPTIFSVIIPFTFGQSFTVVQRLAVAAEAADGGVADATVSSSFSGYAIQQSGLPNPEANFIVSPEPATFGLAWPLALIVISARRRSRLTSS
jgi:hypothetical protein